MRPLSYPIHNSKIKRREIMHTKQPFSSYRSSERVRVSHLAIGSVLILLFVLSHSAAAQSRKFQVDYTVKIASLQDRLFHVTAEVSNIDQSAVELSLPTWTPGWYTIENYYKNVLRFQITDAKGTRLPQTMTRKQTWRIDTHGVDKIRAEFDYYADVLALNQAKITDSFAFFTGTELFLEANGHAASPCTVTFDIPKGWKIISALKGTPDPMKFTAPDYDTLVDAPTEMGAFDVAQFQVEGKPHYFVATPSGSFSKENTDRFTGMLAKIAVAEAAIFGGLPYDKYVYFYFFSRPESNAAGALEHLNSHVAFADGAASPERLTGTAAHEFFHLWNVKRIRPIEMWPYDYSRENETPLLWVSEGFTNYYGNLSTYRAGLESRNQFLESVASAISGVEANEARAYISPAESSVSTWIGYDTPVSFGISYYTQGQNLGALLDLSIRHDSGGMKGLDDLMRFLYKQFYEKGRGFSTEDMIEAIDEFTRQDDFYRRYVSGVEVPPYDTILGYAGYKVDKSAHVTPVLGLQFNMTPEGPQVVRVEPGSGAASGGIAIGDIVLSIDGVEVRRRFAGMQDRLSNKIGKPVNVVLKRDGKDMTLPVKVGGHEDASYRLVDLPNPTPEQLKLREEWLKK
jgi:predicted metalloprotease with PDZ domain